MYGNLSFKYKVDYGSVYKFEKGLFVCGSAVDEKIISVMGQVDAVYTDPPWNLGNMKMFYTFAGQPVQMGYYTFIEKLFKNIFDKTTEDAFIYFDSGMKQSPYVYDKLRDVGFKALESAQTYYGSPKRPCNTTLALKDAGLVGDPAYQALQSVSGLHGVENTARVIANLKAAGKQRFYDPCCGKLDFVLAALDEGFEYVQGIDLIPDKLALGLSYLEKRGYTVEKVR